jgi:signal transduction histidine kinase/ActR/RegA family two-component response regulator
MVVPPLQPTEASLEARVRAELVRTAYADALYGASFAMVVVVLFGGVVIADFPLRTVLGWMMFALACNALRLVTRWFYRKREVPVAEAPRWARIFTLVSAASGFTWGVAAWLFYTPYDSIYRVIFVLVLAGMTTGASRLLAPILSANLLYLLLAVGPLIARVMTNTDTRGGILVVMMVLYLVYMTVAARQQLGTLQRTTRLGYENAALVESLGAEIRRREVIATELRAASDRALAANRAKSEFLATMSHEIRTPMNGLIGMLRIVRDSPLTPVQRDHLETASGSADALLDLLNNVLDFSKIEAGRLELERIAFSPFGLVGSVAAVLQTRARAKGLELAVMAEDTVPATLLGDPTRLRQVLFNLIGNAIKFTDRGRVEVRLSCAERTGDTARVKFAIVDTGIGIAADALPRLFNPFTQADSSMSRRFGGTGLGLAISQKLVEAMDGRIDVVSETGRGSTFHFTLPLALAPAVTSESGAGNSAAFKLPALTGRVLIVEDDRVNQRVIGHFLKQMGLETGLAQDGHAAVEFATGSPWDAILMDCQLPGLDGLEATRRIRTQRAGRPLPIIALTANASLQDRTACLEAGMDDFLAKPVRVEVLAAMLQKWLPPESR